MFIDELVLLIMGLTYNFSDFFAKFILDGRSKYLVLNQPKITGGLACSGWLLVMSKRLDGYLLQGRIPYDSELLVTSKERDSHYFCLSSIIQLRLKV